MLRPVAEKNSDTGLEARQPLGESRIDRSLAAFLFGPALFWRPRQGAARLAGSAESARSSNLSGLPPHPSSGTEGELSLTISPYGYSPRRRATAKPCEGRASQRSSLIPKASVLFGVQSDGGVSVARDRKVAARSCQKLPHG
jgi:hypothetical protein